MGLFYFYFLLPFQKKVTKKRKALTNASARPNKNKKITKSSAFLQKAKTSLLAADCPF
jgi:hypothetical protein